MHLIDPRHNDREYEGMRPEAARGQCAKSGAGARARRSMAGRTPDIYVGRARAFDTSRLRVDRMTVKMNGHLCNTEPVDDRWSGHSQPAIRHLTGRNEEAEPRARPTK